MKLLSLLTVGTILAVVCPVQSRYLDGQKDEKNLRKNINHCEIMEFDDLKGFCYVVDDIVRLVVDPVRTFKISKEGISTIVKGLMDIVTSKEMLGRLIQSVILLPSGILLDSPNIIQYWIIVVAETFLHTLEDFEQFTTQTNFDQLVRIIIAPLSYPIAIADRVVHGVQEGLNRSGMEVIAQLLEDPRAFLDMIVHALGQFFSKTFECRNYFPIRMCEVGYVIKDKSMRVFWTFLRPIANLIFKLLRFLHTLIYDISQSGPVFMKYCNIVFPSYVCSTVRDIVPKIIDSAKDDFRDFVGTISEIFIWIRVRIFEDVPMISPN